MQKLSLSQTLQQKLSPQQIQFIKLLQVPTAELDSRVEAELEINPALEEGDPQEKEETDDPQEDFPDDSAESPDIKIEEYLHDDYSGYKMQGDGKTSNEQENEVPILKGNTLYEQLINQLGFLNLEEREELIGKQLIGSIDGDGYIRLDLEAIVKCISF